MKQEMGWVGRLALLGLGLATVGWGMKDLPWWRHIQLGMNVAGVVRATGQNAGEVKVVSQRPALRQELEWRPQSYQPGAVEEAAETVKFEFLNGELYKIVVVYDREHTEGMTVADLVEAVSKTYGVAVVTPVVEKSGRAVYGSEDEVVARWTDESYRFELARNEYGPVYRLVGVLRRLEGVSQAATQEAARLDLEEQPRRDEEKRKAEVQAERQRLEKARVVNRGRFKP